MQDQQVAAIRRGLLSACIPQQCLALWATDELQLQVCGSPSIPIDELKKQTRFTGRSVSGSHAALCCGILTRRWLSSPEVEAMFWEAMEQLSDEERSFVLKFATGRIRLCVGYPLRAPFVCAESPSVADRPVNLKVEFESSDSDMLPTSATCYQSIYMPKYADAEKMLTKLRIAALNCMSIDTD